jgi:hypothetical protein
MMEQPIIEEKKKPRILRFILKFLLWTGISILALASTAVVLVFVYEDDVKAAMVGELNKNLNAEIKIDPQNIDLTVIRTFPNAAVEFKNVMCYEALKIEKRDTLFTAGRISLQFNILDLFNKKYNIKQIDLEDADLRLKVDKKGNENYIIWKTNEQDTSSAAVKFELEKINLDNIHFSYKNKQNKTKLNLSIKAAECSGKFNDANYTLISAGNIYATTVFIKDKSYLQNKNIKYDFDIDVNEAIYTIKEASVHINEVLLSTKGTFKEKDSLIYADISFKGEGLDIKNTLSLLPESQQKRINDYKSEGEFYVSGILKGALNGKETPEIKADFGVKNASIIYKPNDVKLTNVNFIGSYNQMDGEEELKLSSIKAMLNNNSLEGEYRMVNFSDPYIDLNFKLDADLAAVNSFYPIDTITKLEGKLKLDAIIKGKLNELQNDFSGAANYSKGIAQVSNLQIQFKNDKNIWLLPQGKFELIGRDVKADSLRVKLGSSDAELSGELINFVPWMLKKDEKLAINASSKSNFISLDEIMYSENNAGTSNFELPKSLSFQLNTFIKKLKLGKFEAADVAGKIYLKDQKIYSENLSFEGMDGDIALSGILDASNENILIKGSAKLVNIDVKRMMYEMNNFSQEEILDKHIKGRGTFTFDFSTQWDKKLNCDDKSILAHCDMTIEQGELINYKPLESLAKYVELKELQHIKFNTLQSHLEIKDRVISISKTSIKNSAMNVDFYGTHTFDNIIDYHIKLLLSEVLAKKPGKNKQLDEELALVENDAENTRCVYLSMTGSIDNPKISYDRKAMKEKIKEDIKTEKQNLKNILKEEFGLFKKDSTLNKSNNTKKADQQFIIDNGNKKENTKKLEPKKKPEEDEDF